MTLTSALTAGITVLLVVGSVAIADSVGDDVDRGGVSSERPDSTLNNQNETASRSQDDAPSAAIAVRRDADTRWWIALGAVVLLLFMGLGIFTLSSRSARGKRE